MGYKRLSGNSIFYIWRAVCFLTLVFFVPRMCLARMSSDNYKIDADSINAGGGTGTSDTFKLSDTAGEAVIGGGSSATYKVKAGFQYMVNTYLTLAIDGNPEDPKNLGSLVPGSPVTGQTVVTVTTDSWNGYTLDVSKDHKMLHTDKVTELDDHNGTIDGPPDGPGPLLWEAPDNLGFGFTLLLGTNVETKWGSTPDFKYAAFPATDITAHVKEDFKSGADGTTIGYKADAPQDQKSGAYSCTVTYTAVGSI